MFRFIFYLILIFSISQASDFEKAYNDYSKGYSNLSKTMFLSHYVNKSDILHKYFFNVFGFYYGPKESDFFIRFIYTKEISNIDINLFFYQIKRDIEKMICNDLIINSSVHSGINKISFDIILDDPKQPYHLFVYDNKTVLRCFY